MDSLSHSASNSNPPKTSGIYKITCTANKRIYIGSAVNLRQRKNKHFNNLRQNKHNNPHMQNAWNKYGEQAFIFEVLELVLPIYLTAREQYWFNKLKPFGKRGFNIATEAGSTLGAKHSPESIERSRQGNLGKKLSPEHVEKIRQANLGRKPTPEEIEKRRQALLGRKFSPETIEKLRQAALKRERPTKIKQPLLPKVKYKPTPETIEKLRQANLGKKWTPEQREKLKNRKPTPEAIEKTRQANLGRKRSPEIVKRMKQVAISRKRDEKGKFI